MTKRLLAPEVAAARKALRCLYIAVESDVADDVSAKVEAAFAVLVQEPAAPSLPPPPQELPFLRELQFSLRKLITNTQPRMFADLPAVLTYVEGALEMLAAPSLPPPQATVKFSTGRFYLDVAGVAVAMEADPCRDPNTFEGLWTPKTLQEAADKINAAAPSLPPEGQMKIVGVMNTGTGHSRSDNTPAERALSDALPPEGWQSIATVPRDGRMVLVFPSSCWTDDTEFDYEVTFWDCDTDALFQRCDPDDFGGFTHWMPLPAAPSSAPAPQKTNT